MTRIAVRGLLARKLRTALTVLAVLLGVTMISGTFVLTDTISRAFDELFAAQTRGADAVVSGALGINTNFVMPPSFDAAVLDAIRDLPESGAVEGQISDQAAIVGADGKIVGSGGAPTTAATFVPEPFTPLEIVDGRVPAGPDEVVLDADTAEDEGFAIGEPVTIATNAPKREFELVGTAQVGGGGASLGGATFVLFDLPTAQQLFGKRGEVDFAYVAAAEGTTDTELVSAIRRVLPEGVEVRTAAAEAEAQSEDIAEGLGFLTTGLLAFAFIALLVGAFLIFNTFSITVAQRTRELALLRTIGASRRQLLGSVIAEALVIGVAGSVIGLAAGLGFAKAIQALFKALGLDLPATGAVVEPRTVIACLLTGTVVTVLGALGPALRATRVAPVEALRDAATPGSASRFARATPYLAGLLILGGAGLVAAGLLSGGGDATTKLAGAAAGAVVLILGVAMISPRFVPGASRLIGAPLERLTVLVGRLARENAVRNPGRTAATSAALMIGLALVLFVTIFASGLRTSFTDVISRTFAGDLAVYHSDGFTPIPPAVRDALDEVPGIETTSVVQDVELVIAGRKDDTFSHGVDPATIGAVYRFDWKEGSDATLRELGRDGLLLEEDLATEAGLAVGDRVRVAGPGGETRLVVRGIYRDDGLLEGATLSLATIRELATTDRIGAVFATYADGEDGEAVQERAERALEAFPEAEARSQQQLKDEIGDNVNQILGLFYALLAMSVVISMFGIVNTLTLSIHERTRELGLLRAVGMSRRDVRRMVRYESVITAAFGAVLGLILGIFFAFVVTEALRDEGIRFSLPVGQIVALLVFALLVGVFAAVLPARRASRLDVLRAISYE